MHVCFVVEGGPEDGLGHIYHSAALADYLDVDSTFLTPSGEVARRKLAELGYDPVTSTGDHVASAIGELGPDVVVVDVPWVERELLRSIRERSIGDSGALVVIGNSNLNLPDDVDRFADVVVDFDIGGDKGARDGSFVNERTGTRYLVGLRHFVLRDEFYQSNEPFDPDGEVEDVLLMFGGADPLDLSSRAVARLLESDTSYAIDVVIGSGYSHHETLQEVVDAASTPRSTISIESNVDSVARRMENNDVVLTSPGLTMMEAILTRTPPTAFFVNESQEIWSGFPFVFPPERIEEVEPLMRETHSAFEEVLDEFPLDFESGRREVAEAIRSAGRKRSVG